MRVLFLEKHPIWIHGLPNGFTDLGHEVLVSGPLTETNIPIMLKDFKPDFVVLMGWTDENIPVKQCWICRFVKTAGVPLVLWATEDPTHSHKFTQPLIRRAHPDFVFTISPESVDCYRKLGIKAEQLDFGYHPCVHRRTEPQEQYRCAIAVVANAYPQILAEHPDHFRITSLRTLVKPLIESGIRVDFWGREWDRMQGLLGCGIPAEWIHGYAPYTEANSIYSSADIVIGLQNHTVQLTQRTYEILGSGGFLLTSDTPAVRRWFEPGKDLVVSASPEETVELVCYYAGHAEERESIRRQGETAAAVHSYRYRAEKMIDTLRAHELLDRCII